MSRKFVVKMTHGREDIERVGVGLTVAATAISSGVETEMWLMHEAVFLGTPGYVEELELEHAPPLIELFNAVVEGGKVFACTQCMMRRKLSVDDLRTGVSQAGAPMLVASLAEDGSQALDF
jgi:predicted peroxiredoxin